MVENLPSWLNPDAEGGGENVGDVEVPDLGLDEFNKGDLKMLMGKLNEEVEVGPWSRLPDLDTDSNWHTPTCTLASWKHTDVRVELSQGIAYIVLNRPDVQNRLSASVLHALSDAVIDLLERRDLRVVVFMAEGKLFCAGSPLESDGPGNPLAATPPTVKVQDRLRVLGEQALASGAFPDGKVNALQLKEAMMWLTLTRVPQVTFSLMHASAMGTGLNFCSCVDLAISVKSAFFAVEDLKSGNLPGVLAPHLVLKMGPSNAKRLMCGGENMSATTAKGLGLLQELVESVDAGHKIIKEMCAAVTMCGPGSVAQAKKLVLGVSGQPISEPVMFFTGALLALVTNSEEARVGMIALQQKVPKPWEEKPIKPLYGPPDDELS